MEAYRKDGARIVDTFHRERFSSDRLKTEAVEGHLAMDLGAYRFQGFIDRLARDERGLLHIIDYKTGRRVPRSFSGKEAEQLEAYAALVFSAGQERELNLVLEFVRNGKRRSHRISADEAVAIAGRLKTRIDAVEASTVFPPSPGRLCDWCGFNDICDAYGDQRSSARGDEPFSISL
jgi:putative RecB family exonuclease